MRRATQSIAAAAALVVLAAGAAETTPPAGGPVPQLQPIAPASAPPFGHALRKEFMFEPNSTNFNHGSYGGTLASWGAQELVQLSSDSVYARRLDAAKSRALATDRQCSAANRVIARVLPPPGRPTL